MGCRIVLAQLEGSGRGGLGSYNTGAYEDLSNFLQEHPMRDGDAWLELLLKKNEMLGAAHEPQTHMLLFAHAAFTNLPACTPHGACRLMHPAMHVQSIRADCDVLLLTWV